MGPFNLRELQRLPLRVRLKKETCYLALTIIDILRNNSKEIGKVKEDTLTRYMARKTLRRLLTDQ